MRQPTTLALAATIAVSTGGIVTWQATSSGAPPRPAQTTGMSVVSLPPNSPAVSDREERASRGTPRQTVPSTVPVPVPQATQPRRQAPVPAPAPSRTAPTPPAPPATTRPPGSASPSPSTVAGGRYVAIGESFSGEASYYGGGDGTDGGPTASGETFDASAMTAASPTLPFDTLLNVCYQARCVVVRINDRGPFIGGRILDLSAGAAQVIGMLDVGVALVTATPVKLVG